MYNTVTPYGNKGEHTVQARSGDIPVVPAVGLYVPVDNGGV